MNAYTNKDLVGGSAGYKRPRPAETSPNENPFAIKWFSSYGSQEEAEEESTTHLNARITFSTNGKKTDNKLCLMGRAQLKCLQGCVEILGYLLDPSHDKVPVESPPWSSLLVFEPLEADTENAVIQVESWWPQEAENNLEPTFELVQSSTPGARPTIIPSTWEHAMDLILPQLYPENGKHDVPCNAPPNDEEANTDSIFRMAICGAKSVGKSTFLRYATNRILHDTNNAINRVAILDADVGQPEMGPPGIVTLTVVNEPFWTPPHYRSMASVSYEQQFSYFFGSVTSKNDPDRYIELVKRLVGHYEHDMLGENMPLLINLDGWVKGLGYELLTALLTDVLSPSHVIQIVGTTKSKQFQLRGALNPEISSAQLHVVYAFDSSLNITMAPQIRDDGSNTLSRLSEAEIAAKVPISCSMPSHALRALRLCTYFLNDVTIWYHLGFSHDGIGDDTCEIANRLAAALPYAVPFEAVDILWEGSDHFSDLCQRSLYHSDLILDALNAKIVGLCCRRQPRTNDAKDDKAFDDRPCLCIGLGLIRSIDRAKRLFYILTPVAAHRLKDVTVLVGGTIEVPIEFWFRGVHSEAFPYQSLAPPNTAIGAEPMKSRNNIARKSLNK